MAKYKYVCDECGNEDLTYEANVIQNWRKQQYEINELLDYIYCYKCGNEVRESEIRIMNVNANTRII